MTRTIPTRFIPRVRLAAIAAVLAAAPVLAPAAAAQEPDTARALPLDTVMVRVLNTPVTTLRAPFPVAVVREQEIRLARPSLSAAEALAAVPGVQVDNRFNYALGERISIRGFGARAQFGVRGVRVLVDDVPATMPDGQTTLNHVDPSALGRAEVVRGPASALYGNASGGVIRFSTVPAPRTPLASEYRLLGGSDGLLRLESSAGGRAGRADYRAYFSRLAYEGYRAHSSADNSLAGGSLGLRKGPDRVRLSFAIAHYDAANPGSLSDSLLRADRGAAFARNVEQRTGEEGRHGQLGLTWRREGAIGTLDVTGWALARTLDNPIPNRIIDLDRRAGGVRAAFSGGAAPLRWTAGGELQAQRDDRENHLNQAGERGALVLDQRERVTGAAAFAQAVASPLPRLEVLAALRYDRFRFSADDRLAGEGDPDDSGARVMDEWSRALGASLQVARGVSVYGNYAEAFETPTTTELANRPDGAGGFNPSLDPQKTRSVEVGAKARVAPGVWLEAAGYRAAIRDALIPFEVAGQPGRVFFRNAGRAEHQGIEAGAVITPAPAWTARAAYTWTDARFGEYVVGEADLQGNRVPGIAPHRLELSVLAAPARGPFAGLDLRHVSATPVADDDAAGRHDSPAYTVLDVRGGWEGLRARGMELSPFAGVTNLLDREYNTSVVVNAFGRRYYEPGPGRAVYAGLRIALGHPTDYPR